MILDVTAYQNICDVLSSNNLMPESKCLGLIRNQSSMRVSDLLSFIVVGEYEGYKNFKENNIKPELEIVCRNLYFNR